MNAPIHHHILALFTTAGYKLVMTRVGSTTYHHFDNGADSYVITTAPSKCAIYYTPQTLAYAPIYIHRGFFLLNDLAYRTCNPGATLCCSCNAQFTHAYPCWACKLSRDVLRNKIIPSAALWLLSEYPLRVLSTLCNLIVNTDIIHYSYAPEISPSHYPIHEHLLAWFEANKYVSRDINSFEYGVHSVKYKNVDESVFIDADRTRYIITSIYHGPRWSLCIPRGLYLLSENVYHRVMQHSSLDIVICASCGADASPSNQDHLRRVCHACTLKRRRLRNVIIPAVITWSLGNSELIPELRHMILALIASLIGRPIY